MAEPQNLKATAQTFLESWESQINDIKTYLRDASQQIAKGKPRDDLHASLRQPDAGKVFDAVIDAIRRAADAGSFTIPPCARQFQQVEGILEGQHRSWAESRNEIAGSIKNMEFYMDNRDFAEFADAIKPEVFKGASVGDVMRRMIAKGNQEQKDEADKYLNMILDFQAVMRAAGMQPMRGKTDRPSGLA